MAVYVLTTNDQRYKKAEQATGHLWINFHRSFISLVRTVNVI